SGEHRRRLAVALALAAGPLLGLWRLRAETAREERLVGFGVHLADRLRVERLPALAPPLLHTDHPQTFYAWAPDGTVDGPADLALELGDGGPRLEGTPLGGGLFVLAYDPRRHGPPAGTSSRLEARLHVDGARHTRWLRLVRPEPHPRWLCSDPEAGLAAAPSEETDELIVVDRDGLRHRIPTADGPSDCAFLPGRRIAVSHRYDPHLWVVAADSGAELGAVRVGRFQERLAVEGSGEHRRRLAVALAGLEKAVAVLEVPAGAAALPVERERFGLEVRPDRIAWGQGGVLAVSSAEKRTLCRFRRSPSGDGAAGAWAEDAHLWLGRPAVALTPSVDGGRLFVAVSDYRPEGRDHRGNHFVQDQILTLDVGSWEVSTQSLT
ncbi:MAG: hypothetical protein MI919_32945, partial [Holophagales bacterium]|nr:hypothetical protein [Holophagales bacterium]